MKFCLSMILAIPLYFNSVQANSSDLPILGDSTSGTVSLEKEYSLGRTWLRALRARTPQFSDPLVHDYIEYLLYRLAEHSELQDRRLELTIVNSPALNAFAVPGGVIGVNTGLFIYAQTEQEFASVLAHELAHLSQRHFSRNVDAAKRAQLPSLAALLGSIALIAATGGDAGVAALATTQAAFIDQQLRYSRQFEQEADRVGITTLAGANMDPRSMASMFGRMWKEQRLQGSKLPEFLLTHPVTESRISDATNRADQLARGTYSDSLEYYLMRNRVILRHESMTTTAIKNFQNAANSPNKLISESAKYGLALAYRDANQYQQANQTIEQLMSSSPNRISYVIAFAEINLTTNRLPEVVSLLEKHLALNPNNYPLSMALAKALTLQQKYKRATDILKQLSQKRPNLPDIWYDLAEAYGLNNDILNLHQSRAEYFILTGNMEAALAQLEYGRRLAGDNYPVTAQIAKRMQDIKIYQKELKEL